MVRGSLLPLLGVGYFLFDTVAVELDVGPTLKSGGYESFGLIPALVWRFHKILYATGRLMVTVDPELNLAVLPVLGVTHTLGVRTAPFFELGVRSTVRSGEPDFGLFHLIGLTYLF
jgi:hypothetical protein